jgi:ribonuclease P protein component
MHVVPKADPDLLFNVSATLSSTHRLLRVNGFGHVIRAENITDKYFKVFFVSNQELNARLGIIVAKKTISRATGRNYAKRIIRNIFRQHSVKQCKLDVVVMVRRSCTSDCDAQVNNLILLLSRVEKRCAGL